MGSEAEELLVSGEVKLVDVRPTHEYDRKHVQPCFHIPLYDEDKSQGLISSGKRVLSFGKTLTDRLTDVLNMSSSS